MNLEIIGPQQPAINGLLPTAAISPNGQGLVAAHLHFINFPVNRWETS